MRKNWLPFLPAAAVLLTAAVVHSLRSREEQRLLGESRAFRAATLPAGTVPAAAPGSGRPSASTPAVPPERSENPPIPPPENLRSPAQLETFLTAWTDKVLAEEKRLRDAGQEPYTKDEIYKTHCAALPTGDLLIIVRAAPPTVNLGNWSMSVRSSPEEIRELLYFHAYEELTRRDPFLALQLAPNQPGAPDPRLALRTLMGCAQKDPAATWRVIQEKFGGRDAPADLLSRTLRAAVPRDYPARMELAREWGILDRVAPSFKAESSETPAGQEAWIRALHETAPAAADREEMIVQFTREVETSGGFAGLQQRIGQLAEPGTPLYDRILRAAAGRDLEEAAAAKADWILAHVTPTAAGDTAAALMKTWTETDPLPASEWLDKVPASAPWRKAAVLAFADAIRPHDPEAAAQWARTAE